jgi:hypothetical protein
MAIQEYSALLYQTTTGQIVAELPLVEPPQWSRQINGPGSWACKTLVGDSSVPELRSLRQYVAGMRFSVAVCYGSFVCQAGPIFSAGFDDGTNQLSLSGPGLAGVFANRLLVASTWTTAASLVDTTADVNLTGTLPDIAKQIVTTVTTGSRPAMSLPLDIPALDGGGSNTRFYPGYDMVSAGQRLQELSQVQDGPDYEFAPYKVQGSNYIRHAFLVGKPFIAQTGAPLFFDYGTSLASLVVDSDASKVASTAIVKGSGNERTTLFSAKSSTTLTDNGWPTLDTVDTTHTSAIEQGTLDGWALADLALWSKATEQWKAVVRADAQPQLGSYTPGMFATYNLQGHGWVADGQYRVRLLGMSQGGNVGEVVHVVEGRGQF